MSRRRRATKREILPDAKFGDIVITRFMNALMYDGKKSAAEGIVYGALDVVKKRGGSQADPVRLFHEALDNVKPAVEVRSRRVGGATYQVPVEVRTERRQALAIRWIIDSARKRGEHTMEDRLSNELHGRREQPGCRGEEARGHPPDGRSEQGVQPLPLVTARPTNPIPRGTRARARRYDDGQGEIRAEQAALQHRHDRPRRSWQDVADGGHHQDPGQERRGHVHRL